MNAIEQTRLHVLNNILEHQLPVAQAAELLGVSERHAWRILAAYRKEGTAALAHFTAAVYTLRLAVVVQNSHIKSALQLTI